MVRRLLIETVHHAAPGSRTAAGLPARQQPPITLSLLSARRPNHHAKLNPGPCPDPMQTSVPATPRLSRTLKRLLFIATIGFVFLLRFTTNEILLTVLCIAVLIGLVYYLASGQASPDPTSIYPLDDLSRLFTRQRTHFIPTNWLQTHGLISSVDQHRWNSENSFSFGSAVLVQMQPDLLYVSFQYKVAGALYTNGFIVACDQHDRFLALCEKAEARFSKSTSSRLVWIGQIAQAATACWMIEAK